MTSDAENAGQLPSFRYKREHCRPGVLHIGVGAFHRAHQAVFFDRLLHRHGMGDWGIIGVNLRPEDRGFIQAMAARDNRYVLKTLSPQGEEEYREIGAILRTVDASRDMTAAAALAADPHIAVISVTVTEGGYYLLEDGCLDTGAEAVRKGLTAGRGSCLYTYLRHALNHRRAAGAGPLTLINCDNLRGNGDKLRSGLDQYLQAADDPDLRDWIRTHASFPNGMVDRITPRPDPETVADVERRFGMHDPLALTAERFLQWVLEDDFAGRRPPLDQVGVTYVDDVTPYEDAKIRILNAGHSITAYLAALKGYADYGQAIADPVLSALFEQFQTEDAIPALGRSPVNLPEYKAAVRERFGNPHISDSVARICMDGADKMTHFILPTLEAGYRRGHRPNATLRGVAAWYVYMRHVLAGATTIEYVEPRWKSLEPLLAPGRENAFAGAANLWGRLPATCPAFPADLLAAIETLQADFPITAVE